MSISLQEILDTRFLIDLFYSPDQDLRKKLNRKLDRLVSQNDGILPTIALAEMIRITCDLRGKSMAESRYDALVQSGLKIQDLTAGIAKIAGILKSKHKNIPIGDCVVAATAVEAHGQVLSNDPHFDMIEEVKRVWI